MDVWRRLSRLLGQRLRGGDRRPRQCDNAVNPDGTPNTAHSLNPVPIVVVLTGPREGRAQRHSADVAPTVLKLMGLEQPADMTGKARWWTCSFDFKRLFPHIEKGCTFVRPFRFQKIDAGRSYVASLAAAGDITRSVTVAALRQ